MRLRACVCFFRQLLSGGHVMLCTPTASGKSLGYTLPGPSMAVQPATRATGATMVYVEPRPVQIIPSVLPADWANSTSERRKKPRIDRHRHTPRASRATRNHPFYLNDVA